MAIPCALLSGFLLLFLLCSPSSAKEGYILISGGVLTAGDQISFENVVFVVQNDCKLARYNKVKGFQSNTSASSTKCTVTLSDYGQLIIKDSKGSFIWSSQSRKHPKGEYAAILKPEGEIGIYGPAVWSTPLQLSDKINAASVNETSLVSAMSLLFSFGVLNPGSKLVSRDYVFELTKECGLRLTKSAHDNTVVWASPSYYQSAGEDCFARLNSHGQLSLLNDNNKKLWSTRAAAAKGQYVLALKLNGQATIYGPCIWTTATE